MSRTVNIMIKHNRSKPLFQPFPFALSTIIDIIVMLIDIDNNGTHTVNTIKDSNIRIQADYNILSKYLKGCFKGIPWNNFCHIYNHYTNFVICPFFILSAISKTLFLSIENSFKISSYNLNRFS
jgi:hypothetical protein